MSSFKEPGLAERQNAAATAKKAALSRFRENLAEPAFAERQAARHVTRITRAVDRKAAKMASELELAQQTARDQELAKQVERDAAATAEQHAAEVVAREADQKAARDARYAARKIRKK
jgi:hypothetical protein